MIGHLLVPHLQYKVRTLITVTNNTITTIDFDISFVYDTKRQKKCVLLWKRWLKYISKILFQSSRVFVLRGCNKQINIHPKIHHIFAANEFHSWENSPTDIASYSLELKHKLTKEKTVPSTETTSRHRFDVQNTNDRRLSNVCSCIQSI